MDQSHPIRVLGYGWQHQSLGRVAGYRAALSAIRTENAEWVSRFRAIPIGIGEIMGTHSKKVSVRTVVLNYTAKILTMDGRAELVEARRTAAG